MLNDFGYIDKAIANIREVAEKQEANIKAAAKLMADAIADDKLINVYAGGGHTTLAMGEMFFRAGGLANINPLMETALSVFNQALKYLELERTVNFGASIVKYYGIKEGDVVLFFHNIGINPATIDAAMPKDHFIRHPNGKNLFDYADVCIDDYNPVGDAVVNVPGMTTPIGPVSNVVDFTIAHLLEIETCRQCVERGIVPPVWNSANAPGGDEKNAVYLAKYKPLVKCL